MTNIIVSIINSLLRGLSNFRHISFKVACCQSSCMARRNTRPPTPVLEPEHINSSSQSDIESITSKKTENITSTII